MAPPHLTPVDEFERRQSSETVYRILDDCRVVPECAHLFELEELSGEEIATLTGLKWQRFGCICIGRERGSSLK